MKRRSLTSLLLFGLVLCGPRAAPAEGIPITGTVLDEEGRPLAGAEVTLHPVASLVERGAGRLAGEAYPEAGARALSGREGRFRLEAPEPGFWEVFARAEGRVPLRYALGPVVEPEELDPARLLADAGLRVRVTDGAGEPVPGAVVEVDGSGPADGVEWRSGSWRPPSHQLAAADAQGRVRLPRIEGEEVTLWAVAPGRQVRMEVGQPPARGPVRLILAQGPTRRVRVLDLDGSPVKGAVVWFSGPIPAGVTGDDGTLEVPLSADDPSEPVEIQVDSPDGLVAEFEIRALREGEEPTPVEVRLERPPMVSGRVLEADSGDGLAGALVWPYQDAAEWGFTDRTGSFRLPVRRDWNEERVVAVAPGYLIESSTLPDRRRAAGQELILALDPAAALEGTVVDAAGDPVAGAEVRVLPEGGRRRGFSGAEPFARTGRDGTFRVAGLEPDRVHVVFARHEDFAPGMEEMGPAPEAPGGAAGHGQRRFPEALLVLHPSRVLRGRGVAQDGAPVAGATVKALPGELTQRPWAGGPPGLVTGSTAADGTFELADVLAGPSGLAVIASGYAPFRKDGIEVPTRGGATDVGDLVLEPEAFLEGRVVDPEGEPVAAAQVQVWPSGTMRGRWLYLSAEGPAEPVATGEDGSFRVGGLPRSEPVTLRVKKEGWVDASMDGIRPPTDEPVSLVLRPAATLAGVVVDEARRAVPDAEVRRSWRAQIGMGAPRFESGRSDDRGAFELTGLPSGQIAVEAQASGFQVSAPLTVELAPGERREGVEIVLEKGVVVNGRVLGPDGLPVARARVTTRVEQGRSYFSGESSDETGADGRFTLDTLAPGRVVLEVRKEGFARAREELDLRPGGASIEIHLERGAEVSGRVVEADGSPGAGRELRLSVGDRFGGGMDRVTTAADGSFLFRGVADGEYRLAVYERHYPFWTSPDPVRVQGAPVSGIEVRLPATTTLTGRFVGLEPDERGRVAVEALQVEDTVRGHLSGEVIDGGRYRMTGLTPGRWTVSATAQRSGRQAQGWVEVEAGQAEATLDLEFGAGFTVTGIVLSGGEPLPGARVRIASRGMGRSDGASTGGDGRFRVDGVAAGHHMVVVQDPLSGAMESRQLEVDGDREVRIELDSYRVLGTVYAADGSGAVAGASVRLQPQPSGEQVTISIPRTTATGEDGSFLLTGLGAGSWRLHVEKAGFAAHASDLEVLGGDMEAAPVYLEPAGRLEITARLADGRRPSAMTVTVVGAGGEVVTTRRMTPVEAGRFVLDTVPAGTWDLVLSAAEGPKAWVSVESPGRADVVFPEPCTLVVSVPELATDGSVGYLVVTDPASSMASVTGGGQYLHRAMVTGGRAAVENLPPGTWKVIVSSQDDRTWSGTVTVAPESPAQLVLE